MASQVIHSPTSLVTETSRTAAKARGRLQSIPVDARRWTLSTMSDHAAMARPVRVMARSAELGPESTPRGPGRSNAAAIAGHNRANAIQPNSVAMPTKPTHGDTSLLGGRGRTEDGALMRAWLSA